MSSTLDPSPGISLDSPSATLLIESALDRIEPCAIGGEATIGRDRRCTIWIDHPTVSRTHARIYRDATGWHFVDLGSQNGSKLGEARATAASALQDGAELRLGRVRAWFFSTTVPAGWSPPDAPKLAGKLIRCVCGQIGWAPVSAGDAQLRCNACGREITRRDPGAGVRSGAMPVAITGNSARSSAVAATTAAAPADCAACHTTIAGGETMHTCPECAATMHAGCWEENRGCATYGCSQVGVLDRDQETDAETVQNSDEMQPASAATSRASPAISEATKQSLMAVAAFAAAGLPTFGVPPIGYGAWLLVTDDVHGEGRRRYLWAALSFAAGVVGFACSARWWLGIHW